jgi:hypothetical protein
MVIVGGWAHRLFRFHPLAQGVAYEPLLTLDTDVAIPRNLEVQEHGLRDRLASAGFKERLLGDHQPPVVHYQLGDDEGSFYAEFLTPLIGSEYDRAGKRRATARIAGVTSQRLRYIDLLMGSPWKIELSRENGFPVGEATRIQIAHPTRFIAQKLLIHPRRERRSREKDILYLHDTIELFGASLDVLQEEWRVRAKKALSENAVRQIEGAADALFSKASEDVRAAARVAAGRAVTPEGLREVCHVGLKAIFTES